MVVLYYYYYYQSCYKDKRKKERKVTSVTKFSKETRFTFTKIVTSSSYTGSTILTWVWLTWIGWIFYERINELIHSLFFLRLWEEKKKNTSFTMSSRTTRFTFTSIIISLSHACCTILTWVWFTWIGSYYHIYEH